MIFSERFASDFDHRRLQLRFIAWSKIPKAENDFKTNSRASLP